MLLLAMYLRGGISHIVLHQVLNSVSNIMRNTEFSLTLRQGNKRALALFIMLNSKRQHNSSLLPYQRLIDLN